MDSVQTGKLNRSSKDFLICMLISLSFLWTGCGYLSWFYHLAQFYDASTVDMLTEVIGYLFQAGGLIAYVLYKRRFAGQYRSVYSYALISAAGLVLNLLAVLSPSAPVSLVFGYGMNIVFGMIAGNYLTVLAEYASASSCGIIFGAGYGIGSILSYFISLIGSGSFLENPRVFFIYTAVYALTIPVSVKILGQDHDGAVTAVNNVASTSSASNKFYYLWLPGITILLLSCVKSGGFYFNAADLGDHNVSLELSRSFYAAGLIAAGLINDRNRSAGAVLCVAALVFPFFSIAGSHTDINYLMWVLGYIFFGFYAVYRVLLFIDISKSENPAHLACLGLMWGRLGDAAGAASGIMLSDRPMVLITVMALLFVICIFLFFHLYHIMYMHPVSPEVDYIQAFAARYELSQREADIFRMIIGGSTNKEIAENLYISENTVKFHVRNILRKTDCSKRKELLALYDSTRSPERNY